MLTHDNVIYLFLLKKSILIQKYKFPSKLTLKIQIGLH